MERIYFLSNFFALTNNEVHEYRGEGKLRYHPLLGNIYKFPSETGWIWPIFMPRNLDFVLQGMELGLDYTVISDLKDRCEFLHERKCSIHEFKPNVCNKFSFRIVKDKQHLGIFDEFEQIGQGLKKRN